MIAITGLNTKQFEATRTPFGLKKGCFAPFGNWTRDFGYMVLGFILNSRELADHLFDEKGSFQVSSDLGDIQIAIGGKQPYPVPPGKFTHFISYDEGVAVYIGGEQVAFFISGYSGGGFIDCDPVHYEVKKTTEGYLIK